MLIHSLKARSTWWWYEAYAGINCCSLTKYKISVIISKLQTMELSSPGLSTSMGSNIKKYRSELGDMHQNESEIFVNDTNNDNSRQNDILDSENSTSTELNRSHSEIELKDPSFSSYTVLPEINVEKLSLIL